MILGSPLGGAPKINITLKLHFPEYPEDDQTFDVKLGDSIEIKEDERLISVIKVIGLYETSSIQRQSTSDPERLPDSSEIPSPPAA
jgi:hypothetical protein